MCYHIIVRKIRLGDCREAGSVNRRNNFGPAGKPTDDMSCNPVGFLTNLFIGGRMNTAKLAVKLYVYHSCIIEEPGESGRLLVPYLIHEIKEQLKGNVKDAVLNRVYYNLRMGRIGSMLFGVEAVSRYELDSIGIYLRERLKGGKV